MAYEILDAATCRKIAADMAEAPANATIELPPKAVAALYATIATIIDRLDNIDDTTHLPDDPDDGEDGPKLKVVGG